MAAIEGGIVVTAAIVQDIETGKLNTEARETTVEIIEVVAEAEIGTITSLISSSSRGRMTAVAIEVEIGAIVTVLEEIGEIIMIAIVI